MDAPPDQTAPLVRSFLRSATIDATRWGKIQFLNIDGRRVRLRIVELANAATPSEQAAELLAAIERSGLDLSHCELCRRPVVCLPDGMPVCEACVRANEA